MGKAFYTLSGYDPGAAGSPSSPTPAKASQDSPLHLAVALFRGTSSFGALMWQSLWGLGFFWDIQSQGPALPQVSVTLTFFPGWASVFLSVQWVH